MSDIGTAMAGYNPDSRIVGWISVFVARLGRPLFFGTERFVPKMATPFSNTGLRFKKRKKRGIVLR